MRGKGLELVNVTVPGLPIGSVSNEKGFYSLEIPENKKIKIVFSHIEYEKAEYTIKLKSNEKHEYNIRLKRSTQRIDAVDVQAQRERSPYLTPIDPKVLSSIPNASGNIESVIKTLPGVSSNNELSSQYSVRGGNFDENLVYVNDIEIYRPLLIRSGQQEGLSFVNSDLVESIYFSAGGFDAKYGDKMSSVLDIKYKRPQEFKGKASASLMGGSFNLEGVSKNNKLSAIAGMRYKTSEYILNSLDTDADYNPSFLDFQTYLTYDISKKLEIAFLGNYASNKYDFVPKTRNTSFGTINEALSLKVYFDGQEKDQFETMLGALSATYMPTDELRLIFTTSAFQTIEEETYDIQGQYWINELDKDLGSDAMGDSSLNIGVGTFLNHARNYLTASVINFQHKAYWSADGHNIQWGAKIQQEIVDDEISEWEMLDSAGYSVPYSDSEVLLKSTLRYQNSVSSMRYNAYFQDRYTFLLNKGELFLSGGLRASYWDFNEEFLLSPRVSLSYKPNIEKDIKIKFASGIYYQPPFYKELKDYEGNINYDLKSQRSIHFVLGGEYDFRLWNRPFKLISEIYYKDLDNLVPYSVDNVQIRYYGENLAHGYAVGIDAKINGEFVKGVDSWASLSIMQTKEDLENDSYTITDSLGNVSTIYPGYIRRPTDQLVNFGMFFQDYLPGNPSFKMQLSFNFGTGLAYGPPDSERYEATLEGRSYYRIDIGFSKQLIGENTYFKAKNPLRFFKAAWISFDVFNLIDKKNTISYLWIKDIRNREYAIPNYLTGRRLNLKLVAEF